MSFPPPIRLLAPLVALAFGLFATWLDYRLNLDLDLARHLAELRERADANGRRVALLSERLVAGGDREILPAYVAAMAELPGLEIAGVVDEKGLVLADSTGTLRGQSAASTRLAEAASLVSSSGQPQVHHGEDAEAVFTAHPFRIGSAGTGWALLEFDRSEAIASARADALTQLRWMASAMALLSFVLWAVLHFGLASRLGRLAESVRALGVNGTTRPVLPGGGDEVGRLAGTFLEMSDNLHAREAEQLRLEAEMLEISERERRRIGHDLHDGIGQRLTAASMALNAATAALQNEAPAHAERVAEIGRQLREAIAETRALSHGLAPVAFAEDGLATALAALAESTSGAVRCVFEQPEPVRVADEAVAGHLFRIAQEAVNNALKHAAASEIRIGLEQRGGCVLLEVDDDGQGFSEGTTSNGGIGLQAMRFRARLIGGTLEIGSAPAGGARISCRVKLNA